ncbi:hypothetical protein MJT46_017391 [Ovis ammon polii x Ovis aries]|nr:hypothetical protein MJT46_017391 [Ovis ammon polii x Ovis aries]
MRDTAATALKERASACPHSRGGLTPLGRLQKYPKIHVSTGEESSGSGPDSTRGLRHRHRREWNPERPPRNSQGDWPFLRPPERVPEVPVERREELQCRATIPRVPQMCQSIPEEPVFPALPRLSRRAEDRLPPRVHVEQPCGKASWESLVGKTRGKTIDPLLYAADCMTLLLPLWRKAQVHARIRDED